MPAGGLQRARGCAAKKTAAPRADPQQAPRWPPGTQAVLRNLAGGCLSQLTWAGGQRCPGAGQSAKGGPLPGGPHVCGAPPACRCPGIEGSVQGSWVWDVGAAAFSQTSAGDCLRGPRAGEQGDCSGERARHRSAAGILCHTLSPCLLGGHCSFRGGGVVIQCGSGLKKRRGRSRMRIPVNFGKPSLSNS